MTKSKKKRIKVAYVIHSLSRMGGSERHLQYLLNGLEKNVEGIVFCLFDSGLADKFAKQGYEVVCLNLSHIGLKALWKVYKAIVARNVQIVHAYGIISSFIVLPGVWKLRCPFISARRELGQWRKIRHLGISYIVNFFSTIITVNSPAVRDITENEYFSNGKVKLIRNGVNLDEVVKNIDLECGFKNDENPVMISVANCRPVKNLGLLIDAIEKVVKAYPNVRCWVIGDGPERMDLERKSHTKGLEKNIQFYGQQENVKKFLVQGDLFVLTSIAEGSPNSILEAMQVGLPVVATNVGGIQDIVVDGVSGLLIKDFSADALSQKICQLLGNKYLRAQYAQKSICILKQKFSLERLYNEQIAIYRSLI
ncbi:MAG: glycosyltransferase [Desulfobacter sp.]|nr:MAG: glycosyltransferase [Desulfobacter sp.]